MPGATPARLAEGVIESLNAAALVALVVRTLPGWTEVGVAPPWARRDSVPVPMKRVGRGMPALACGEALWMALPLNFA